MKTDKTKLIKRVPSKHGGNWLSRDPNNWYKRGTDQSYTIRKVHMVTGGHVWILWGFYDPVGIFTGGSERDAMSAADDYIAKHA